MGVKRRNQWDKELEQLFRELQVEEDTPVEVIAERVESELSTSLKIGFFGSPGSGKSALMNAMIGERKTDTKTTPGTNVTTHIWGEDDTMLFVDLPGYGGLVEEHTVDDYWVNYDIESFDVLLCCFETKLNRDDEAFFKEAKEYGIQVIFVRTKSDNLYDPYKSRRELKREIRRHLIYDVFGRDSKLVFTSSKTKLGIGKLHDAVTERLDTKKQDIFYRNAKAYSESFLKRKSKAAHRLVFKYSFLAAGKGAEYEEVLDTAVDVDVVTEMIETVSDQFGLTEERLQKMMQEDQEEVEDFDQIAALSSENDISEQMVLEYMAKFKGQRRVTNITKAVPIVGGMTAGFGLSYYTGREFIRSCEEIAELILDAEIQEKR